MSRKIERGRLKAAAAVFCAVALFVGAALAAQAAVTLSSKDSVNKQAEQLYAYIERLPEKERQAWYRQLEEMVTEEKKSSGKAAEPFQNNTAEGTVWYGTLRTAGLCGQPHDCMLCIEGTKIARALFD